MSFFSSFAERRQHFEEQYRCYPLTSNDSKVEVKNGDKIILPQSAFQKLALMEVTYPLQFQLKNEYVVPPKITHVGVLEFTAPEGRCYVPKWVLKNLDLSEVKPNRSVGIITVVNVTLPLARFVKFKPRSVDFLDLSNHRAVLESTLRSFSCVTKGDEVCLNYNGKEFFLLVKEVAPLDAASIIEADVNVDFEAPDGYVEPIPESNVVKSSNETEKEATTAASKENIQEILRQKYENDASKFVAFNGSGNRVDGKQRNTKIPESKTSKADASKVNVRKARVSSFKNQRFQGKGNSLR